VDWTVWGYQEADSWGGMLTTHFTLQPSLKIDGAYTSTPSICLHTIHSKKFNFYGVITENSIFLYYSHASLNDEICSEKSVVR
jgi:hypothetical protein